MVQFKMAHSLPGDNCGMLLFSMLAAVSVAVTAATQVSSIRSPNNQLNNLIQDTLQLGNSELLEQQLANDKMQALGVPLQPANKANRYMDHYQLEGMNDLLERAPEVEIGSLEQRRQQQQQQQRQKIGQGVINGNHATYVEPPADFKPIIYGLDNDKQAIDKQQQQVGGDGGGSSLDSIMLNQLVPGANGADTGQQIGAANSNHPADSSPGGDNQRPAASESHVEYQSAALKPAQSNQPPGEHLANPNQQEQEQRQQQAKPSKWAKELALDEAGGRLKPAIGRWSDWYDLGIEPDLATSDTLGSNQYSPLPAGQQSSFANQQQVQAAELFNGAGQLAPTSTGTKTPVGWQQQQLMGLAAHGQFVPQQNLVHHPHPHHQQQQPIQLEQLVGQQVNLMPTNGFQPEQRQLEQQYRRPRLFFGPGNLVKRLAAVAADFRSQIKGSPVSSAASYPAPVANQRAAAPIEPTAGGGGLKVALNQWMASSLSNLMDQQHRNEYKMVQAKEDSKQPDKKPAIIGWNEKPATTTTPTSKQQREWKLRKMRKMPTPANQQQQQQPIRPKRGGRQSKSHNAEVEVMHLIANSIQQELLSNPKQVNGLIIYHDQPQQHWQQQQQQLQLQQMNRLQLDPVAKHQPQVGQRVQPPVVAAGAKQRHSTATSQQQPPSKRVIDAHQQQPVTNSSAAAPIKRQVKKRRIKTLLPVGLSSWFLGGIRDLDGRHWHLPAEVVSRLAVNDVDFAGHSQAPKVGDDRESAPANWSSVDTTSNPATANQTSGEQQVGPSKVPLRKVVPR